ncbi:MAG: RDD family protein [Burkholderiales bacterium]|nr:RDD family protein [Burkholderiales bacterium]
MTNTLPAYPPVPDVRGVLGARIGAFFVDFIVIAFLWVIFSTALIILGFLTFGLSWLLLPPLFPAIALIYNGLTVSGRHRGTVGMRTFGIELVNVDGSTAPFVVAAVHALFYYVSVSMLTPFILLFGLVRQDRRMIHDLLSGLVAVRRAS